MEVEVHAVDFKFTSYTLSRVDRIQWVKSFMGTEQFSITVVYIQATS